MAELRRSAQTQNLDVETLLTVPYKLHTLEVKDAAILDLRENEPLDAVGLKATDIVSDNWDACQQVGHAAWFLHFEGVLANSATGNGHVLTLFENRLRAGTIKFSESRQLDPDLYRQLSL